MLLVRVPFPSSPPGSTRWSMLTHGEIKQCRKVQQASAPHGLPGQARQRRRRKSFSRHVQRFPGSLRTPSLRRSRICGAPLTRCTASGTRHSDAQKIPFSQRPCARVLPTAPKKIRPQQKGRRSAERRMCQPYPRSSDKRRRLPMLQRGCAPLSGARPPSGASPRHSPPATTPMAQPQNRVSARHGAQVFCPFAAHALCVKHAPCGPVLLPVDRGPGAARERIAFTSARGHRGLLRPSKVPSRKAPLVRRDFACVTQMRTIVKPKVTKKETFAGPPGARP